MFLVISTFPNTMISLLSSVIFYQIFFHAVTLYIYLFAFSLRSFLPWLEKVKTQPFFFITETMLVTLLFITDMLHYFLS